MDKQPANNHKATRRPRSVTLVGILLLLYGLLLSSVSAGVVVLLWNPGVVDDITPISRAITVNLLSTNQFDLMILIDMLLIGIVMVVGGIGILRLRGWAWLMALIGLCVHLVVQIISYWRGQPSYWEMLLSAVMILLLNLREAQQALGLVDNPAETTSNADALWEEPADANDTRSLASRREQ